MFFKKNIKVFALRMWSHLLKNALLKAFIAGEYFVTTLAPFLVYYTWNTMMSLLQHIDLKTSLNIFCE